MNTAGDVMAEIMSMLDYEGIGYSSNWDMDNGSVEFDLNDGHVKITVSKQDFQ